MDFELQPYKPSCFLRITILTPCFPMVSDKYILPTREKGGETPEWHFDPIL